MMVALPPLPPLPPPLPGWRLIVDSRNFIPSLPSTGPVELPGGADSLPSCVRLRGCACDATAGGRA